MEIDFECAVCGRCCRQRGYVFITEKEAAGIAGLLGLDREEFRWRYLKRYQRGLRIAGPYEEPCIFLCHSRCRVYERRPSQCRAFPFWGENFTSSGRFEEISSYCEGIKVSREV